MTRAKPGFRRKFLETNILDIRIEILGGAQPLVAIR